MPSPQPLVLYDISSPLIPSSHAPNPSKSRLALSFKRIAFTTKWVDILSIPSVRKSLSCPAVRKLDDGSDYFTLPMLHDPALDTVIGDSFDIANYLDTHYPDTERCLFPVHTTRTGLDYESPLKDTAFFAPLTSNPGARNQEYARFNQQVDITFSAHVVLVAEYLPFNPDTAEEVKAVFVKRTHLESWDQLAVRGEARKALLAAFETALTSLADCFKVHEEGPYLEGDRPNYADLIVGGWLNMMSVTLPEEEWRGVRGWHEGVFGRLHDALRRDCWVLS